MEMNVFACPECGKEMKISPDMIGQTGSCPYCDKIIVVGITPENTDTEKPQAVNDKSNFLTDCKVCGKQIAKDAEVCPGCGHKNIETKSLIVYTLLAIFGGCWGMHNLYARNEAVFGVRLIGMIAMIIVSATAICNGENAPAMVCLAIAGLSQLIALSEAANLEDYETNFK